LENLKPGTKAKLIIKSLKMEQKNNSVSSAETKDEVITKVEANSSSPNNAKPNVGGRFCPSPSGRNNIKLIIAYLETTTEDSWCLDVVKTQDGKNCLFGHLFDFGGSKLMDWFECNYATTFMVFPINDGTHTNYKQSSPKERCIAYLKDLESGKEKTVCKIMEEYDDSIEDEDDAYEDYLQNYVNEKLANCDCGAYGLGDDGKLFQVADCCC
jgi:hypothetical protein